MKNNTDEENKKLREQVRFLRRQNVQLSQRRRIKLLTIMDSEPFKVGVLSDTHMGSHFDNLDWLNSAYEVFVKEKVKFVIHAGDIVDGQGNYRGQEYEQHTIGFDAQLKYCVENYPRTKLTTYLVTGNHSFKKISGAEIGRVITQFRPDLQYIGEEYGNLVIKMPRGIKIWIQVLHPSGGRSYAICFDDETEIMTEDGFKLFRDLDQTERVATLNLGEDRFEWQKPTDYVNQEYSGDMFLFKARTFNLCVTPDHRMLVRRYGKNLMQSRRKFLVFPQKSHIRISFDWQMKKAQSLRDTGRQDWQMKKDCSNWIGKLIPEIKLPLRKPRKYASQKIKHIKPIKIDDVAELAGWYISEGHVAKNGIAITISQSINANPVNNLEIFNLLERIDVGASMGKSEKDIRMYSTELAEWLVAEFGRISGEKRIPKWLKNQPKDVLRILFDTLIKGDGWIAFKGFGYKSISKQLRDDIAEIGIKLGYAVSFSGEDTVSFYNIQTTPTINNKPEIVAYKKKRIYCVSVPNGIVLVKRKGRIIWSGNSYKPQKIVESMTGGTKPNILIIGHWHSWGHFAPRNVEAVMAQTVQKQTPYMRRKHMSADVGFCIIEFTANKDGITSFIAKRIPYFEKVSDLRKV